MISKRWLMDMEVLGYVIINNSFNLALYRTTLMITNKKEVFNLKLIESEIIKCIIDDIIECCKEDLESKQDNKNPEKIIKELVQEIMECDVYE